MLFRSLSNDGGSIRFDDEEISQLPAYQRTRRGIARSFQIPRPFASMSVVENLVVPLEYVVHRASLHTADTRAEAMEILRGMGLADKADTLSNQLSQVELRKLELARAMAARPKLLISDEAMAGLSSNEVSEVLEILFRLNDGGITIIMIEHIMQAVMKFSQRVVCLDAGAIICEGTPEATAMRLPPERSSARRARAGRPARRVAGRRRPGGAGAGHPRPRCDRRRGEACRGRADPGGGILRPVAAAGRGAEGKRNQGGGHRLPREAELPARARARR